MLLVTAIALRAYQGHGILLHRPHTVPHEVRCATVYTSLVRIGAITSDSSPSTADLGMGCQQLNLIVHSGAYIIIDGDQASHEQSLTMSLALDITQSQAFPARPCSAACAIGTDLADPHLDSSASILVGTY